MRAIQLDLLRSSSPDILGTISGPRRKSLPPRWLTAISILLWAGCDAHDAGFLLPRCRWQIAGGRLAKRSTELTIRLDLANRLARLGIAVERVGACHPALVLRLISSSRWDLRNRLSSTSICNIGPRTSFMAVLLPSLLTESIKRTRRFPQRGQWSC